MIPKKYTYMSGLALLALALAFPGCSRKADQAAAPASGTNQPGQQAATTTPAPAQPGQQDAQAGGQQARQPSGQQARQPSGAAGRSAESGPGYASDRFSKQPEPPRVHSYTLDAGSRIAVRTAGELTTKTAKVGDRFEANLERPLEVDGHILAPKGTSVFGQVTVSDPSGRLKGSSMLGVQLTAIALPNGDRINIQTSTNEQISKGTGKKTAAKVGIGAGLGAIIGAIAGGGKGAAIGAGAGGAAGGGVAYATGGNPAIIPSESVLSFQLTAPVTVTSRD